MPITTSAKKALRASEHKRVFNLRRGKAMKDTSKAVKKSDAGADSKELLSKAYQAIDKAAKTGLIKKNAAARKKSRLAKNLKKKAGK